LQAGYGRFFAHGKRTSAHRFSYETFVGRIPDGMVVMHKCDVMECVNPDHLDVGTQADNMRDMSRKGRSRGKMRVDQLALSRENVDEVRRMVTGGASRQSIAARFGVSQTLIHHAVHGTGVYSQYSAGE